MPGPFASQKTTRARVLAAARELQARHGAAPLSEVAFKSGATRGEAARYMRQAGGRVVSSARSDLWLPGRCSSWVVPA